MCLIFQFIYHTFNDVKSHIFQHNDENVQYNGDSTAPIMQMQIKQFYQCNTKSLKIDLKYYMLLNQNILGHVSMFKNIEIIGIKCMGHHLKVLQLIVENCGKKIQSFKSEMYMMHQ